MVGKPWLSAFQNFFRIENPLNIKKVMGRNMCIDCIDIPWNLVYFVHNVSTASTCVLLNVVFILHIMYRLLRHAYH